MRQPSASADVRSLDDVIAILKASVPFFMYLPFQVTHSPYEIPPGYVRTTDDPVRQVINGMVNIMDEAVHNVTAALKEASMYDDTLILFTADNGGVTHGGQLGNNWHVGLRVFLACIERSWLSKGVALLLRHPGRSTPTLFLFPYLPREIASAPLFPSRFCLF